MDSRINSVEKMAVEDLIDKIGLAAFLEMVSEIAYEKAEHISSAWQDKNLAQAWRDAGATVLKAAVSPRIARLP